MRLSNEYFLRSVRMLSELANGELVTAIVHRAISAGNVGYLDQNPEGDHYASMDSAPPDALRRPVSILAVAGTLGLPYETTRRHVQKLLKIGWCKRVKGASSRRRPPSSATNMMRRCWPRSPICAGSIAR